MIAMDYLKVLPFGTQFSQVMGLNVELKYG